MDKLTWLETIEAEKQEKIRAKKKALIQEDQRQKRLWYLPLVGKFVVLIIAVGVMYLFMIAVGFVAGQAMKDCPTISCPVVQSVCELPKTGGSR